MTDQNQREAAVRTGSVFVSYARLDDLQPPFEEKAHGWVKFFWEQLRWELINRGVQQARLWLDRYEIEPAEDFTEKIEQALQEARVIIPILSPNWVQREWCRREINRFAELHPNRVVDGIVPVRKIELSETDLPLPLKNREGYKFYAKDSTGRVREFYWRGLEDRSAYLEVLKQVAVWIANRLVVGAAPPAKAESATKGQVVYLATPADELRDAWRRVGNDLIGAGHVVLPTGALPDTVQVAEATIRDALGKAALSVHFVGESEGTKPEGSDEGIVRLQLRLARELSGSSARRVLWVPKWLPGRQDQKRDPFTVLDRFGGLKEGEEIYAEEVTDLSQMLRGRLMPTVSDVSRDALRILIAAAAQEDDGLVGALANRLQSKETKVTPVFASEIGRLRADQQGACLILVWDKAEKSAIDAVLSSVATGIEPVVILWLPGKDKLAKQQFFREGIYVERLDDIPSDRKAARELLVKLDIAPSRAAVS